MSFVNGVINDLRERRLWPIALLLVVALVAVPVLLSKSSSAPPRVAEVPATAPPGTALPAVSVSEAATSSRLTGKGRNPFDQLETKTTTTSGSTSGATSPTSGTGTTGSTGPTGSTGGTSPISGGGTGPAAPTGGSTPPSGTIPAKKSKPAPTGLSSKESYEVSLGITNSSGGLDTIDPLERLSVLPSDSEPMLVELGVLQGGRQVLFAVQPGTAVSGPGSCTPGPIDCEILSLRAGQTESLAQESSSGSVPVALFAVTGITAAKHNSDASAQAARRQESAAGRKLIEHSNSSALSLFQYKPSLGALVDLRTLTVGGN